MTDTKLKDKIVQTLTSNPGLTMSSLCRVFPKIKGYQIRKLVTEMTGAGIVQPMPKGSHDGLRLVKSNT